jgi:hypothetical protein
MTTWQVMNFKTRWWSLFFRCCSATSWELLLIEPTYRPVTKVVGFPRPRKHAIILNSDSYPNQCQHLLHPTSNRNLVRQLFPTRQCSAFVVNTDQVSFSIGGRRKLQKTSSSIIFCCLSCHYAALWHSHLENSHVSLRSFSSSAFWIRSHCAYARLQSGFSLNHSGCVWIHPKFHNLVEARFIQLLRLWKLAWWMFGDYPSFHKPL